MISLKQEVYACTWEVMQENSGAASFTEVEKRLRPYKSLLYHETKRGKKRRTKAERIEAIKRVFFGIPRSLAEKEYFNAKDYSLGQIFGKSSSGLGRKLLIGIMLLNPAKPSEWLEALTLDDRVNDKADRQIVRYNEGVVSHGGTGFYKLHTVKKLLNSQSDTKEIGKLFARIKKKARKTRFVDEEIKKLK